MKIKLDTQPSTSQPGKYICAAKLLDLDHYEPPVFGWGDSIEEAEAKALDASKELKYALDNRFVQVVEI